MEKESVVKRSVAELAGKFTCQIPVPTGPGGNKPERRRPPRTLQLPASNNAGQGQDEPQKREATSHPPRKHRNSALIEKLQANLTLSPTAMLPSPMSPGAVKPPPSIFPHPPCSPASPGAAPPPNQKETPASFEKPADGSVLLSINKGRARLSIKRRPPSRRHRKSSGDDAGPEEEKTSPVSDCTALDCKEEDVFEKMKVENSSEPASSTSEQQEEPNQSKSTDPDQQPTAEEEKEIKVCEETSVSDEKEENVEEEEKKPEEPLLTSSTSESIKHKEPHEEPVTEHQSEPDKVTGDEKEQEEKKEEEEESQKEVTEECKVLEQ